MNNWDPNQIATLKQKVYPIVGCCQTVHRVMGPFLNEYMYQDALEYEFQEQKVDFDREYYFSVEYKGKIIKHKHFVDFKVDSNIIVECKAIENLGDTQRQQLWNYMRLSGIEIGILYNFAPIISQCEKYYLDKSTNRMIAF